MIKNELTNRKLTQPQRMRVFALMARGDTTGQINADLDKHFGVTLAHSTLSEMRKKHKETIDAIKLTIRENEVADVEQLNNKARRILNHKLDRAERDMTELEQIDEEYRLGQIDSAEYKRKKGTLMSVSITEISQVSKSLYEQSKPDPNATPALPEGTNPAATEALLDAIKRGDTVELQRIVLNPTG